MKKRIIALILSVLTIMTVTACRKTDNTEQTESGIKADNTEKSGSDTKTGKIEEVEGIKTIQLVAGEGYKEEYYEHSYDTIIKASYPVIMLYYGDENKFPKLNEALADSNRSTKDYQLEFIEENLEFAKECYDKDDEYYRPLESSVE